MSFEVVRDRRRRLAVASTGKYFQYLQSLPGAVALWPLWETSGTNADDIIGNNDGTFTGVDLANLSFPMGTKAPYFDGINDKLEIYSAGLNSVFNPLRGTAIVWCDFDGTWGDTNAYIIIQIGADANNRLLMFKDTTANLLRWYFIDGATFDLARSDTSAPAGIFMIGMTWDKANNKTRAYLNGSQVDADGAYAGTWSGALTDTWTDIGIQGSGSISRWKGWLAYAFLANQAYTPAQIADIYNRGLRS